MTDATDETPPAKGPGRLLRWVLWIQLGFAGVLFSSDLARVLPQIALPSTAPGLTSEHLEREAAPELVFLHSPGGSVSDALAIGRRLRDMGVETAMSDADVCLSACPYILAAGAPRQIPDGAWVGVHQHFFGHATR